MDPKDQNQTAENADNAASEKPESAQSQEATEEAAVADGKSAQEGTTEDASQSSSENDGQ